MVRTWKTLRFPTNGKPIIDKFTEATDEPDDTAWHNFRVLVLVSHVRF